MQNKTTSFCFGFVLLLFFFCCLNFLFVFFFWFWKSFWDFGCYNNQEKSSKVRGLHRPLTFAMVTPSMERKRVLGVPCRFREHGLWQTGSANKAGFSFGLSFRISVSATGGVPPSLRLELREKNGCNDTCPQTYRSRSQSECTDSWPSSPCSSPQAIWIWMLI